MIKLWVEISLITSIHYRFYENSLMLLKFVKNLRYYIIDDEMYEGIVKS